MRLLKNVLTPLAKSVLIPLRLTVALSTTDEVIQKKVFKSRKPRTSYQDRLFTNHNTDGFKWRNGRYHENS